MPTRKFPPCAAILICFIASPRFALAHGFVGDRFFPATVTTDDPLIADELAIPALSLVKAPGDDENNSAWNFTAGFEFDKVIIPKLSIGVADNFIWQRATHAQPVYGWDNLSVHVKYEVWRSEKHEAIISIGLDTDIGGTGTKRVGRDSFTTFTPTLFFGKGFGDLPDSLAAFKPLAITGTIGQTIPTDAVPNTLQWGLALEYNIPYLQQHVADIGIPPPFKNMIPLVEFAMETPENRGAHGPTTGTINPGVLWESRYYQLGVEALIPINSDSGDHVGVAVQLQIYIDDLFPKVFGHPIFSGE